MLSVFWSRFWRTVTGGSANYVQAIAAQLDEVSTARELNSLRQLPDGNWWARVMGPSRRFDASSRSSDQALLLLDEPTPAERGLGAIAPPQRRPAAPASRSAHLAPRIPEYLVTPGRRQVVVSTISRLMRLDGGRGIWSPSAADRVDPSSSRRDDHHSHPLYTGIGCSPAIADAG